MRKNNQWQTSRKESRANHNKYDSKKSNRERYNNRKKYVEDDDDFDDELYIEKTNHSNRKTVKNSHKSCPISTGQARFEKEQKYQKKYNKQTALENENDFNPHAKYSKKKQHEYRLLNVDPNAPVRLNKFIANSGLCSRRDADKYIVAGVVSINGKIITELGAKVYPTKDKVHFHDQLVLPEKKVYVLLNKPKDVVTTTDDPNARLTVMDIVANACSERIYPVGRLDRNTTGVLLLTNDGNLAAKLTHPKFEKKKIYHVVLDKNVSKNDLETILNGFELEDGFIKADDISYIEEDDKKQIGIEIHSGRNRIVRRIFEHFGYQVERLDRVYFAGLTKKNLPRGRWRFLSEKEVNFLKML